jgi:hypothetical protein
MKEVEVLENPEMGTSGLSSALQLVESTNSFTVQFGTVTTPILIPIVENEIENRRLETFRETLKRVIKKHRASLNALDDIEP